MGHRDEILDDELASPKKGARELIWLWALIATVTSAGFYMLPLLVFYPDFGKTASPQDEFLSGLLSFLHLFMAMAMVKYFIHNCHYQTLLKGGYYILLFGSGVFLLGSVLSIFGVIIPARDHFLQDGTALGLWEENYEAIITIFIVFIKFLLIKPLTRFLSKKD
ncbi:MAG: hypothetical protein ACI94Y_000964 [Maribacter sp.]|jgi:hypothetical protein